VSDVDVRDSKIFLHKAMGPTLADATKNKQTLVALDCGAGVGRVSRAFLLHYFAEVDLVEPSAHLLEAAKKDLCGPQKKTKSSYPASHRAVGFFQQGLESFIPEPSRYDVVWVQWAMLYLKDEDAIAFLQRCAASLRPGGMIFVKENVCNQGFIVDSEDASVTRSHAYNVELFTKRAGLKLAHTALQKDFPKQLFKVRMYALKPVTF
jgi:protein N-terminal methyltransferase